MCTYIYVYIYGCVLCKSPSANQMNTFFIKVGITQVHPTGERTKTDQFPFKTTHAHTTQQNTERAVRGPPQKRGRPRCSRVNPINPHGRWQRRYFNCSDGGERGGAGEPPGSWWRWYSLDVKSCQWYKNRSPQAHPLLSGDAANCIWCFTYLLLCFYFPAAISALYALSHPRYPPLHRHANAVLNSRPRQLHVTEDHGFPSNRVDSLNKRMRCCTESCRDDALI